MIKSYEKNFDYQDHENEESSVEVNINRDNGKVNLYAIKTVVENVEDKNTEISLEEAKTIKRKYDLGDKVKIEITPKNFGRIAAQTARNIVIQKLKDAERDNIYNEFIDREKEIITGTVQRVERGIVYIDLGRVEGIIPVSEQIKSEEYTPNKRLKLFIKEVKNTTKGAQIILSRTDNSLIKRLFELEVPEINDGTVEIFSVAREPGSRKIDIKGLNQYLESYENGSLSVEFDGEAAFLEANGIEVRNEDKDKVFDNIKYHESDDIEEIEDIEDTKEDNSLDSEDTEIAEDSEN